MKRCLCILLAAMLAMSLCACNHDSNNGGESATDPPAPTQPQLSIGITITNTYYNDFLGLICSLSDEWIFDTDAQLREKNNIVGNLTYEEMHEFLEKADLVHAMYAARQDGCAVISINLEKKGMGIIESLDIKDYLESQFSAVKSNFEQWGYTDIQMHHEKITVGSREFDGMILSTNIRGIPLYETAFCFTIGRYIAIVDIVSSPVDEIAAILECFTVS